MPDDSRDVLERAVAAIAIQPVPRRARDGWIGERTAVDQEDVDPAVVVVVEEQPARPMVSTMCFSALAPLTAESMPASRVTSVNVTPSLCGSCRRRRAAKSRCRAHAGEGPA